MKFQANKGHLQYGSLHLKKTEQSKETWRKNFKSTRHIQQLKPVALNWKGKQ